MNGNARWCSRRLRSISAVHVSDFGTCFRSKLSFADHARNNHFRNMTTCCIGWDSSRAGTRVSESDTWTAALWQGRPHRLRHLAFTGRLMCIINIHNMVFTLENIFYLNFQQVQCCGFGSAYFYWPLDPDPHFDADPDPEVNKDS